MITRKVERYQRITGEMHNADCKTIGINEHKQN